MNHPHDRLFKATFFNPDVMASLIQDMFPPELAARIDIESLQLTNNSFIDENLEEHFADLIYQCALSDGTLVAVALLLEHKSYAVKHPHFQLMRYMLNHWEQDEAHGQSPIPIVPVIIFHGEDTWSYKSLAEQMGTLPVYLHQFVPDFDYLLIDLSKMPDEQLFNLRNRFLAVSASLLKYSDKNKLKAFVQNQLAELLILTDEGTFQQFADPIFRYIYEQSNLTGIEIVGIFKRVSLEKERIAMTVYQQETSLFRKEGIEIGRKEGVELGRQEGVELGRQEGRQEGRLEVLKVAVKAMHQAGLTDKQIAVQLKIKVAEVKAILKAE